MVGLGHLVVVLWILFHDQDDGDSGRGMHEGG
jgi:hypothetical protein